MDNQLFDTGQSPETATSGADYSPLTLPTLPDLGTPQPKETFYHDPAGEALKLLQNIPDIALGVADAKAKFANNTLSTNDVMTAASQGVPPIERAKQLLTKQTVEPPPSAEPPPPDPTKPIDPYTQQLLDAKKSLAAVGIVAPDYKMLMDAINHRNELADKMAGLTPPTMEHSNPDPTQQLIAGLISALGGGGRVGGDLVALPSQIAQQKDQAKYQNDFQAYQGQMQNLAMQQKNADQNVNDAKYLGTAQQHDYDQGLSNYRLTKNDYDQAEIKRKELEKKTATDIQNDLDTKTTGLGKTFYQRFTDLADKPVGQADMDYLMNEARKIALSHSPANASPEDIQKLTQSIYDTARGGIKPGDVYDDGKDPLGDADSEEKAAMERFAKQGFVSDADAEWYNKKRVEWAKAGRSFAPISAGKFANMVQAENTGNHMSNTDTREADKEALAKAKLLFDDNVMKPYLLAEGQLGAIEKRSEADYKQAQLNMEKIRAQFNGLKPNKDEKVTDASFIERQNQIAAQLNAAAGKVKEAKDTLDKSRKAHADHLGNPPIFVPPQQTSSTAPIKMSGSIGGNVGGQLPPATVGGGTTTDTASGGDAKKYASSTFSLLSAHKGQTVEDALIKMYGKNAPDFIKAVEDSPDFDGQGGIGSEDEITPEYLASPQGLQLAKIIANVQSGGKMNMPDTDWSDAQKSGLNAKFVPHGSNTNPTPKPQAPNPTGTQTTKQGFVGPVTSGHGAPSPNKDKNGKVTTKSGNKFS